MGHDEIDHANDAADTDIGHGSPSEPDGDQLAEIEEERARRLDPANRPEGAEVDNTGVTLPTVEAFAEMNAADEAEGSRGTADPSAAFRDLEASDEELAEIEAERERRLDPANRPEGAEVDTTGRDTEAGDQ